MTLNTTKMFLAAKWKWIQTFLVCFLIVSPCFCEEDILQVTTEEWIELFNKTGGIPHIFTPPPSSSEKSVENFKNNILTLAEAIKKNVKTLKFLKLTKIYHSDLRGLRIYLHENLLEALAHNTTVKELEVSGICIRSELLFKVLENNNTIEKIKIDSYYFNEEETLKFAKILSSNNSIKELNLESSKTLTLKGKNALREAEDKRNNPGWFSFGKKEPLIILLPNIPDEWLNKNKGRLDHQQSF